MLKRHPAEELLYESGVIWRRSMQRRMLLGCLGCHLSRGADFYGTGASICTGIASGTTHPILQNLATLGVLTRVPEAIDPVAEGRPARVFYRPAATEIGRLVAANLEAPESCFRNLEA